MRGRSQTSTSTRNFKVKDRREKKTKPQSDPTNKLPEYRVRGMHRERGGEGREREREGGELVVVW